MIFLDRIRCMLISLAMVASVLLFGAPPLVDGDWLAGRLTDPGAVVIDMSELAIRYQCFHLPGAVYLPYNLLVK
jgi:3-mercaptopyruvate sulfurtransferase SseA